MADAETPERLLDEDSIHRAVAEVRRITAKPDIIFRSLLIKISKPIDEFMALFSAVFYDAGYQAAGNHFLTPRERISAVAADIGVLVRELEDIEGSETIEADLIRKIARERKLLTSLQLRLERASRGRSKTGKPG